jgi:rhamnogalacturonyl hydrolase YesR
MQNAEDILLSLLSAAERRDYSGYSKFDALNSPLLKLISLNNKWLRFLYTQVVKEFPLNIRPLLRVKPSRNPKGIALFARAYFFLFQKTQDSDYLKKGESLLQWLLNNPSPGQDKLCWGYNFPWQSTIFFVDRFEPNAVVTAFVGEALIQAYRITGNETYLSAARSVAEFMVKDLPVIYDSEKERAVAYVLRRVGAVVLNNQVLTGAFLIKAWKHTGERDLRDVAMRQINYTVGKKTPYDAWYYTFPAERSMIHHDNYHTGGILDGLLEYYEETGDDRYLDIYWRGLSYYERNLFEEDGAPRWMNHKKYPLDIHGSAQGIITFKKAARHDETFLPQAAKIADWAIRNLYRQKSQDFSYRKGRFIKWNYSLMRWCNAWMARALAELIYES